MRHVNNAIRWFTAILATVAMVAALLAVTAGPSAATTSPRPTPALRPGDVVVDHGARAVVPPAGRGVWVHVHRASGAHQQLGLETRLDGQVVVYALGDDAQRLGARVPACSDRAFNLLPWRWTSRYNWRFNPASTPSNLSVSAVEQELRRATTNITGARNDCGRPDNVSATQSYLGRTTFRASACDNVADGRNVTDWRALGGNTLAVTCTFFASGRATESDMRINRTFGWFTGPVPAGCSNRFSVEGVATHERGHTYGLGHVNAQALTMRPTVGPCASSRNLVTLGLGDMLGLEQKY